MPPIIRLRKGVLLWMVNRHAPRKDAKANMIAEKAQEMGFLYHFLLKMIGVFCVNEDKRNKIELRFYASEAN
ncbi:MAG: hypothetical protein H8D96_17280 [Desulfobacterales bacterium]|uniref:Uncharacterized protein n=1 Tax=Candidatus Desulfatibia vada TaxID=2841696 RepID=A0A8J6NUN6_9BACT|nr:hypothetical protein [Candidatus Desulfatibia vada]